MNQQQTDELRECVERFLNAKNAFEEAQRGLRVSWAKHLGTHVAILHGDRELRVGFSQIEVADRKPPVEV